MPRLILYFDEIGQDILSKGKINSLEKLNNYGISYIMIDNSLKIGDFFDDNFIEKHLEVIYANNNNLIYKVKNEKNIKHNNNINLIKNNSYEDIKDGILTGWSIPDYNNQLISSGDAYNGNNYVRASVDKPITQAVKVSENKIYKLSFYSKTDNINNKQTRIQINWQKDNKFISCSINVINSINIWQKQEMIVTAPKDCNKAVIYINSHDKYFIDFDEVCFEEVN